ncbi:transcriptional regulator with XRE-family HTH domain [Xanthobacter flavus]|uniref:Transcriptional regulator with XRE-family HTH domain n=1 Tax=Xanthobacter flavus TaxID=281 RepID=A0A9W6FMQ1_XANFL|nr:hypothetical protein [Xanthobacter flavus]MDR6331946.1 transcriptional regulator with XRE-family HTH domain [Xanthobacter flavus]GLI25620.1 hypothetical protein XFLAVUS301_52940 [Xanthobacter flavus]
MNLTDIVTRASAVRLPQSRIAELSGLHKSTVERTLNGKTDPLHKTLERMEKAVVQEELRLRDYLVGLHGTPGADHDAAA